MKRISICALLLAFIPATAAWSQNVKVRPRDSAADANAPRKARTGPHGGVVVELGGYSGEFRVWSTIVELFVYDSTG